MKKFLLYMDFYYLSLDWLDFLINFFKKKGLLFLWYKLLYDGINGIIKWDNK